MGLTSNDTQNPKRLWFQHVLISPDSEDWTKLLSRISDEGFVFAHRQNYPKINALNTSQQLMIMTSPSTERSHGESRQASIATSRSKEMRPINDCQRVKRQLKVQVTEKAHIWHTINTRDSTTKGTQRHVTRSGQRRRKRKCWVIWNEMRSK